MNKQRAVKASREVFIFKKRLQNADLLFEQTPEKLADLNVQNSPQFWRAKFSERILKPSEQATLAVEHSNALAS